MQVKIKNYYLLLLIIISCNLNANESDFHYGTKLIEDKFVHIVTVNPTKYKIINIAANNLNKNTAYVYQFAKKYKALMAINGGFFREITNNLYVPAGALKINDTWQGIAYHPRAAIGWKANSEVVLIDRLITKTSLITGAKSLQISHFNPSYNINNNYKIIVYSNVYPYFDNLKNNNSLIQLSNNSKYLYNINPNLKISEFKPQEILNAEISIEIHPQINPETAELWKNVDFITSGAPVLIKDHKIILNYDLEKLTDHFIYSKHPRTAICITKDSWWKFIKTQSLTIPELLSIAQTLECKDAINLDGGSSSNLYLFKQLPERQDLSNMITPVTDAIMVLTN